MPDLAPLEALQAEVARLRRAVAELSVLNDLAQAIGSTYDPQEIIRIIVDRSARAIQAEQVTITLVDETARVSAGTLVRFADAPPAEHYHLTHGLLGYMLRHKQPYLSDDPVHDQLLSGLGLGDHVRALLAVPLLVQSRLIGVLVACNKRGGASFDASDQRLLSIIGAQSSQILETARLLEHEKEAARLRGELQLAARIQRGLLPQESPQLDGYEVAGVSWPAEEVGGDYFDFVPLDERRLAFCLGDISGKGLPASLLMANLQATLRAQALRDVPARECVAWCNRLLFRSTNPEKFATLFYGLLDTGTHRLQFCNAGHERPIHLAAGGAVARLATGGLVVGLMDDAVYQDGSCELHAGDLVAVFSDGATDMEDGTGRPFGEERILDLLQRHRAGSAADIVAQVAAEIRAWAGGVPPLDDLTLLAIKRLP
jgi:phosphoserine phosphatase RsbU/P